MPTTPHHQGTYPARAKAVRDQANADPTTKCWRCGRTLAEHPPHKGGQPPTWQAGHILDSTPTSPLLPEASTCNTQAGGKLRHAKRTTRSW